MICTDISKYYDWAQVTDMARVKDFVYINRTYQDNFGLTRMNVFFERHPPTGSSYNWYFKRYITYFFIYIYFPCWSTLQILGLLLSKNVDLEVVYFQIGYLAHVLQLGIKLHYFIKWVEDFRTLCLEFDHFQTSRHRPILSQKILGEMATLLRKLSAISYNAMYITGVIWGITALVVHPSTYILNQQGYLSEGPKSIIPKPFPVTYPFEVSSQSDRIIVFILEFVIAVAGVVYAVPVDLFFVTVFMMVCAQVDVLCKSAETADELGEDIDEMLGPEDIRHRLDIDLFIMDHQSILRTTKKLRDLMNPMLGLEICYFIIMLAALAITGTIKMRRADTFNERFKLIPGLAASIMSIMLTLYLYSWICGRLKEGEEAVFHAVYFTNWYEENKKYRDAVLIMMGRSIKSRPLRMLSSGDMDRETFISGLKGIYTYYNFMGNMDG